MQAKYQSRGVEFIGLTHEGSSTKDQSEKFIKDAGITWANGFGARASIDRLGVQAFPTTFVVGKNGVVQWGAEGSGLEGSLERAIENALAETL